uniref:RNase H type-1 domain-containing protein n=1 Tax=Graphocephala atropunctata TaxID=36148 RepID=A0A1B6KRF7_9HEMI
MLGSRRIMATLHAESVVIAPTRGCPQGGVLSPLLWNLVVDGLLHRLSNLGIYAQGYADDIVLVVQGRHCNITADIMNVGLRCIHSWCLGEGLNVNPSKTVVVPFTRKKNLEPLSRLTLGTTKLEISKTVKYLGLTLDHKLVWNDHLASVLHKARWSLMTTRRLVGTNWGIKPHIALWLYKAIVRPQITYGSLVWWTKVNQSTVQVKLASLQRLACLLITGAFSSSPTMTLEVMLGLLPLDILIKAEARKAAYRLMTAKHWREGRSGTGHCTISGKVNCGPVLDMTSDVMGKETVHSKPYSTNICSKDACRAEITAHARKGSLMWYTDGSLMDGKSGYGVYSPSPRTNISASLGRYCTIFQAEIQAILTCASIGVANRYFNRHILILSDSQAAIKALDSTEFTSKLVWECYQALCTLAARNNVHLFWVPGHEGIEGNECADTLAKEGACTPFFGPEPVCGISRSTAFHAIDKWSRDQHQQRWQSYPGQALGRRLITDTNTHFTRWLVSLSRGQVKQTTALITGHGHFRKHLHTLGINNESRECRICNQSEETARYIILECDGLGVRRRALFSHVRPGDEIDAGIGKKLLDLVKGTSIGLPI